MSSLTAEKKTSEWIEFPNITLLNPISTAYKFTNSYSKTVLLIADANYVSKHIASYLDTTLNVSGFKVTKCDSISNGPLFWTKKGGKKEDKKEKEEEEDDGNDNVWQYKANISDFDSIIIPSQFHGDIWNDITNETKLNLQSFVNNGGSLITMHFRGGVLMKSLINFNNDKNDKIDWNEISIKIGTSFHIKKEDDKLKYKNDVRGIVGVKKENIIYKTLDDLTTVAFKQYGKGICYYIGHDYCELWEKSWNKILFCAIKKTLNNDNKQMHNLNFGNIDIEAFKNLNIKNNDNDQKKDIYLQEFQPDFNKFSNHNENEQKLNNNHDDDVNDDDDDINKSFDGFDDDLNEFAVKDEDIPYIQMRDDNDNDVDNDNNKKLEKIKEKQQNEKLEKIKEDENLDDFVEID